MSDTERPGLEKRRWIAANAAGRLDPEQARLIRGEVGLLWIAFVFILAPFYSVMMTMIGASLLFGALAWIGVPQTAAVIIGFGAGLLLLPYLLWTWWLGEVIAQARVWLDAVSGKVVRTQGQVGWFNGCYGARVDGQRMLFLNAADRVFSRDADAPIPGHYEIFHLPRSRWVVSVQRLKEADAASKQEILKALSEAMPYQLESLELNRRGEMATEQSRSLVRVAIIRSLLVPAAIGGGIALMFALEWNWMAWVAALGFGFMAWDQATTAVRLFRDIYHREVLQASGMAVGYRTRGGKNNPAQYHVTVGGTRFKVSPGAYWALVPNVHYHAYYAPRSREIVSMEPDL